MSDDALIRLENLQATKVTAKQLEAAGIGRYSYCRDLLKGNKSFGEKIARKIEEKMGWPRSCLDSDSGCETSHTLLGQNVTNSEPESSNTAHLQPTIPIAMPYSPSNLSSTIQLLGNLLGALDQRSREMIGHLLKDLAAYPDDAADVAAKAAALATTQRPIVKDKDLNRKLTSPDAPDELAVLPSARSTK